MLRMVDLRCVVCGAIEEHMVRVEDFYPDHCGSTMEKVWLSAPGVHYKPHYSHALGRTVDRYADEDKELAKTGKWIASKTEANSSYQTDIFDSNVTVDPVNDQKIRKQVEKAARKLTADGVLRSGPKGFEYTGSDN